tara:strand:- start:297 stop:596 length:300 start_codon:yes stop_codon:yes gene_type:complete
MMSGLLSKKDIRSNLSNISGWVFEDNKIKRVIQFDTYMASIDVVNAIAKKAEQVNHHPEIIVSYCKILIELTSHDLGGVTTDCFEMATYINSITNDIKK